MISFIVAMDKNNLIGKENQLPWHLPGDLAFFKRVTMNHPIVMGRKTHESIGRVLPGRENIIITRKEDYHSPGCKIIHTIEELRNLDREFEEELFVIGGAELFNQLMDDVSRLYITYIDEVFEGDTFFPVFKEENWKLTYEEQGPKDDKNPYDYFFRIYDRK